MAYFCLDMQYSREARPTTEDGLATSGRGGFPGEHPLSWPTIYRAVVRCRVNLENHWAGRQGIGGSMPDARMLWQVDTCWQGRQGWVQLGKLSIKSFQSRARVIRKHPFSSQRFTAIFRQDLPVLLQETLVDDFFIEKAEVILWCGAGMKNNSAYGSSFFTRVRDSKWQLEEQMPAL